MKTIMESYSLYWVNWIYLNCDGKACHGFFSEGEHSLERAMEGAERVKKDEKTVCVWINRSEEQPDGSHKYTGTPYLEAFVDAFGYRTERTLKVAEDESLFLSVRKRKLKDA